MTIEELIQEKDEWQKLLRLQDWEITVTLVDFIKASQYASGYTGVNLGSKEADIEILSERGYDVNFNGKQDMLKTLVHELVHLHFIFTFNEDRGKGDSMSRAEYESFEAGVDLTAKALVGLYRESRVKKDVVQEK